MHSGPSPFQVGSTPAPNPHPILHTNVHPTQRSNPDLVVFGPCCVWFFLHSLDCYLPCPAFAWMTYMTALLLGCYHQLLLCLYPCHLFLYLDPCHGPYPSLIALLLSPWHASTSAAVAELWEPMRCPAHAVHGRFPDVVAWVTKF